LNVGVALGFLALVAAAVVGLYLLRPPPQRVRVGSTLIWQRVLAAQRGLSQRWRWWLSLLLALVIALALALAVTRPRSGEPVRDPKDIILVVDAGPTMNAMRSDGRTRFEHARDWAIDEIRRNGAGARFFVTDTMRTVSTGTFVDAERAQAVLKGLAPAQGGAPRFPDLVLLPKSAAGREVVFVTDGVSALEGPTGTRMHSVFEVASNVGITAFSVRARATDPTRFEGFVELGNAASQPAKVTVKIAGAGRDPLTRIATVGPRGFGSVTFPVEGFTGGALQASLEAPGDVLGIDDGAFAFLPFNRVLQVALVTAGNRDLERALRLDPRLKLSVLTPAQYAAKAGFDAYVFDRFVPAQPPLAPSLVFQPAAISWLTQAASLGAAPQVTNWLGNHPVLENVSLADVQIEKAAAFREMPGALSVLATESGGKALIVARDKAPRVVAVGFASTASNFASQASFPVFLANAMQWLTAEVPPQSAAVGAVRVPFENAKVEAVKAGKIATRAVPGGTLFTLPASDFATVEAEGVRMRVAVNTTDPAITDINASALPPDTVSVPTSAGATAVAAAQWWPALLILAGVLMLVEWLTYHRRVTI